MFKKMLASFGKGSAVVDLQLHTSEYHIGEIVHGNVMVYGGEVEQKINSIAIGLFMEIRNEHGSTTQHIESIPISDSFIIREKEEKVFAFSHSLPYTLPVSSSTVTFYYDTHLDIQGGVDKKDVDYIRVKPKKEVINVFRALEILGLHQKPTSGQLDHRGQEFAFYPTTNFVHEVNAVEIRFAYEDNGIRISMEVDVKQGFNEIEAKKEFYLTNDLLHNESELTNLLKDTIHEMIHQPAQHYTGNGQHSNEHHGHSEHQGSSTAGMIGGFVAGAVGGVLLNEMFEHFTEDEDENNDEMDADDSFDEDDSDE